jgi:PPOX class probable F420-dependent enzyme
MPSPIELTPAVRAFLEDPLVTTIATIDPDGGPRQVVVWYRLEPDGRILLNSNAPRRWCTNLVRNPCVALSMVDPADGYRWVGLVGVVDEVVDEPGRAREDIIELAHRYHPDGPTQASIDTFRSQPRVSFLVRLTGIHDHLES